MTPQNADGEPESLRELAARVIDNGTAYLRAEVTLAKEMAIASIKAARPTIRLVLVALMLAQCGIMLVAASLGFLLARWLGFAGGFASAGAIMMVTSGLIGWLVVQKIRGIIR